MTPLSDANQKLHATAEEVLKRHYDPEHHTTGVALRTSTGEIYTGISLKAATSAADVHAEPVAVARAILNGESSFETVVAVQYENQPELPIPEDTVPPTRIVSPCGGCREVLAQQAPDISVIVPEAEGPAVVELSSLLPY